MRPPSEAMPCFRDFDRTNFACGYSCAYKTECEEQTPNANETPEEAAEHVDYDTICYANETPEEAAEADTIEPEYTNASGGDFSGVDVTTALGSNDAPHVVYLPAPSVTETASNKQSDPPKSRFDVIDISDEEDTDKNDK